MVCEKQNMKFIDFLYDCDTFERVANRVTALLRDYLGDARTRSRDVLTLRPPAQNMDDARYWLDESTAIDPSDMDAVMQRVAAMIGQFLSNTQTLHHPGYIGHQIPPPLPLASVFEFAASTVNQGMAIYELGPWATAVEKVMVQTLGEQLGFKPGTFSGLVTSGGTLANLTALLTARNKLFADAWNEGIQTDRGKPVIITHRESHYSIERAAGILGIGARQCLYVDSDSCGRTDPDALAGLLDRLQSRKTPVVAVVASACSTRAGSFDDLSRIADICQARGVWLHVDAAHGGAVSFSRAHRHLLAGIEKADSVIWDAHKMLFIPALSTYLFYKNPRDKHRTFNQDASVLFAEDGSCEYDCGQVTLECTKRAAALSLWGVLSIYGPAAFETLIDHIYAITAKFIERLSRMSEIDIPIKPRFNIVLFRYVPGKGKADDFNRRLREFIVKDGGIYLTTTTHNHEVYLRFVVMNPRTDQTDIERLIDTIKRFADAA